MTVFSLIPSSARDLLVAQAASHEREDVELALRQPVRAARLAGRLGTRRHAFAAPELLDDPDGRRRRDRGLAAPDALEHGPQLRRLEVLEQVALGAGLDRLEEVVLVLGDGQDDDGDLRPGGLDARRRGKPGTARHPDVHEHEIGLDVRRQRDRLVLAAGEPDHLMAPGTDERRDTVAEQGMVVDDQDPHRAVSTVAAPTSSSGTTSSTVVPRPRVLVQVIRASMAAARRRIVVMP